MDSKEYLSKLRFQFFILFSFSMLMWYISSLLETFGFIFVIAAVVSLAEAVGALDSMKKLKLSQDIMRRKEKEAIWAEVCAIEEERRMKKGE